MLIVGGLSSSRCCRSAAALCPLTSKALKTRDEAIFPFRTCTNLRRLIYTLGTDDEYGKVKLFFANHRLPSCPSLSVLLYFFVGETLGSRGPLIPLLNRG